MLRFTIILIFVLGMIGSGAALLACIDLYGGLATAGYIAAMLAGTVLLDYVVVRKGF